MSNYQAKEAAVLRRQLEVIELAIPLFVDSNATPASKTQTNDEPSVLFMNTQGITGISVATGAFDTSAEAAAITFATATDTTGVYNLLVRIGEQVKKVVYAQVIRRDGNEVISCTFPTGSSEGITSLGDKIVLNADSAVNLATTDLNATLVVAYVPAE